MIIEFLNGAMIGIHTRAPIYDEKPEGLSFEEVDESDPRITAFQNRAAPRRVAKDVVVARLTEAGKIDAALALLLKNGSAFARWFAPGRTEVNVDDPDAIALLRAVGADPEKILA